MAGSAESSRGWSVHEGWSISPQAPAPTNVPDQLLVAEAAGLTHLQVLRRLGSGPSGLADAEVERRLVVQGGGLLEPHRRQRWARVIHATVLDRYTAMIAVLAAVSLVSGAQGTGAVLASLAVVSWGLRLVGERRARVTATTSGLLGRTATVLRRGGADTAPHAREVLVDELVPGDIVRLAPGDVLACDVFLLKAAGLLVDQSLLNGETEPCPKHPTRPQDAVASFPVASFPVASFPDAPSVGGARLAAASRPAASRPAASRPAASRLAAASRAGVLAHPGICLAGSHVAAGTATAVVTATGGHTHLAMADHAKRPRRRTAFDHAATSVIKLLRNLTACALALALAVRALGWGPGGGAASWSTVAFAVAVAVGLTPEILPVVVSAVLAHGSTLLRRAGVTVTRLTAVHDLGTMDVLCLDKTGTLTSGQLVPALAVDAQGRRAPELMRWGALHSRVVIDLGEPGCVEAVDQALLEAWPCANFLEEGRSLSGPGCTVPFGVDVLPFDPQRRCATVVLDGPLDGPAKRTIGADLDRAAGAQTHTLLVKGAVDAVLQRCTHVREGGLTVALTGRRRARTLALAARHGGRGMRLLALAMTERPARPGSYRHSDEAGLTLLGLVGLTDEPRPEARAAVRALSADGVSLKVLTGDHASTAARACRDLGVPPGRVVLGGQIDCLDEPGLQRLAAVTTVFAQVTPAHKARIVQALRAEGRCVGYLGDGLNDVPALRAADVGISPHHAIAAARQTADVILPDAQIDAVGSALQLARQAVTNISAYLRIALTCNIGNVVAMLTIGATLAFLPMLSVQALVQNLCFDLAMLTFAFDRPDPSDSGEPSVIRRSSFSVGRLARFALIFGMINAVTDLATFAALRHVTGHLDAAVAQSVFQSGWFTENLLTQALTVHVLRRIGSSATRPSRAPWPIAAATVALALVGLAVPLSPVAPTLGLRRLPDSFYPWLMIVLAGYVLVLNVTRTLYSRSLPSAASVVAAATPAAQEPAAARNSAMVQ